MKNIKIILITLIALSLTPIITAKNPHKCTDENGNPVLCKFGKPYKKKYRKNWCKHHKHKDECKKCTKKPYYAEATKGKEEVE